MNPSFTNISFHNIKISSMTSWDSGVKTAKSMPRSIFSKFGITNVSEIEVNIGSSYLHVLNFGSK